MDGKRVAKWVGYSLNIPLLGFVFSSNVGMKPPEPPSQPYNAICIWWLGIGVAILLLIRAFFNVHVGSEE